MDSTKKLRIRKKEKDPIRKKSSRRGSWGISRGTSLEKEKRY